jgi:hypothetical protein
MLCGKRTGFLSQLQQKRSAGNGLFIHYYATPPQTKDVQHQPKNTHQTPKGFEWVTEQKDE